MQEANRNVDVTDGDVVPRLLVCLFVLCHSPNWVKENLYPEMERTIIKSEPQHLINPLARIKKIQSKKLTHIQDSAYTRKLKFLTLNFLLLSLFFLFPHSAVRKRSGALFLIGCFPSDQCKKQTGTLT
ncbi:hypothetical protein CEXT_239791 [Caerostris extrusa]|uniref:Uncharacterized protein n=1 Tax=Caerostris extrusa TaxID=172846 RepID=A0AAV4S2Z0_CAEEX|nr:hypothetical protein CEXT_239791 [Caerostris extrusa]